MLIICFYAAVLLFSIRTFSYGFILRKTKQRGAYPLFAWSLILLLSPGSSTVMNRLFL